jgi:hypothetical protein
MRFFITCLAALALLFASSVTMACPPDVAPDGGGSFSYGGGYGAEACAAPMVAGHFGGYGGDGGSVMVAAPSYGVQSFAAPSYGATVVRQRVVAAPAYGYGGFSGRRFGGGFRGGYGVVAAPVVRQRIVAAPIYGGATVVAAPVVAVPVRAPGPIRGAVQGFFGGVRNRLNGF